MHSLELIDIKIVYSFEIWLNVYENELIIILIDVFDKGQWRQGLQNIWGDGNVKL